MLSEKDIKLFRQLRQQLSALLNPKHIALLAGIQSGIGTGDNKPAAGQPLQMHFIAIRYGCRE